MARRPCYISAGGTQFHLRRNEAETYCGLKRHQVYPFPSEEPYSWGQVPVSLRCATCTKRDDTKLETWTIRNGWIYPVPEKVFLDRLRKRTSTESGPAPEVVP